MSGSPARPTAERAVHAAARPRASRPWRWGTPLVITLCGALFVVSAVHSQGTDLRPGRYTDLASLVDSEAQEYAALEQQVNNLNQQVALLTASVDDQEVRAYHRRVEQLKDPAGLVPRSGPGVRVTLADAPADLIAATSLDPNRLIVHQQDIQAVVNALWRAGAKAVTIQGQRVISTTGIKCEGNAVQLQGVPYSQPYVIQAVGDPGALLTALESDEYLSYYRADALDPEVQIGWRVEVEDFLKAPAYTGLLDLTYAIPLRGTGD